MDVQIAAVFFRGSQSVKAKGHFFGIHKLLRAICNRYSTIYDSILVARVGLWFGLGLGLV